MKTRFPIGQALGAVALLVCMVAPAAADDEAGSVESTPHAAPSEQVAHTGVDNANPIQRRVVEYEGKIRGIQAGENVRSSESTERLTARATETAELRTQLTAALSMPPASPDRSERIDQTFYALRRLVDRLRDDRTQAIESLESVTATRNDALSVLMDGPGTEPDIQRAIDQYKSALQQPVDAAKLEIDLASAHLTSARKLRRRARSHASPEAILSARAGRLEEAASEVRSIPLDVESSIRRTLGEWWRAPQGLTQFQALGSLFLGIMELALLLGLGMWIHGRIPLWTRRVLQSLCPDNDSDAWSNGIRFPSWVIAGDIKAMGSVLGPVIQDLLVLILSASVMVWLKSAIPLAAWLALIFAAGACVRLTQGAIELALITPSENRPGLRVTEEAVRTALLWLVQAFGLLLAIAVIMDHLLLEILAADRIAELLGDAVTPVAALIVIVGLVRWGDTIRHRLQASGVHSSFARWLAAERRGPITIAVAALSLIVLLIRLCSSLLQSLIESRAGLSWLGAALARRQLREDKTEQRRPLPLPTRNAIGQGALRTLHIDEYVQSVVTRHKEWASDPRQGMVAITGDRGCGKSVVMDSLSRTLDGHTVSANAPVGTPSNEQALLWLISATGIDAEPCTESVIEALNRTTATAFLLSNLHRLYTRSVGGYAGLDSVLAVMQATGRHHFWVASFHGPAWSFLVGMHHVGNVGVFPTRIHLQPVGPADLSTWLLSQTRSAGFTPRFDGMLQQPARGPDRARLLERTERAYWRLLAEASMGNPTVAVRLWVDGLRAAEDNAVLDVTIPRAHESHELETLEDTELFALTAIILHDEMTVNDLHRVLNMRESQVRAVCRGLEQLTLISETEHGRYKVRLNWLPSVERHLRRRSFLHKI